jgi:hypothetical protein
MSSQAIAHRLRSSTEFTCSRCGSREAYPPQRGSGFERHLLKALLIQPIRCCDCDALCYAFPLRLDGPVMDGKRRNGLSPAVSSAFSPAFSPAMKRAAPRTRPVHARSAVQQNRSRLRPATAIPARARDFHGTTSWAMGD